MEGGDVDDDEAKDMVMELMDAIKLDHVLLFVMMGLMPVALCGLVDEFMVGDSDLDWICVGCNGGKWSGRGEGTVKAL